ncbi:Oidioi.mRNA.OKI2018_I69.XSR.g15059.t1.cds [Oikopleura dioica]|uniref:Oidioi.mRNA.OKI2018_I69.XSR.g15059.t1.cds n=1 Tax=Oikopleura dioica TaxID=34765 RepID=A0ABN7SFP2_OIKDI|nr:Oidioi.mRNA.OKI2018_I69.XSR.g15059.t1.cds [Oikopleura dioica]
MRSQLSIPFSVDLSNGLVDCGDFPLGIDAEFGRINGSRIKVLQGKVEVNGEPLWKKMRYDGEILPKEIALKFQHCLGNKKNNSACRLSNTPRRIEGALEIDDLTVDMSGKIVLINVSCGNDYILKQSILQVKKANFAVGSFSKTVDLENGTAILKVNKNELGGFFSSHGKDINGRQIACEMHHKLESGDVVKTYDVTSKSKVDFKYLTTYVNLFTVNSIDYNGTNYFKIVVANGSGDISLSYETTIKSRKYFRCKAGELHNSTTVDVYFLSKPNISTTAMKENDTVVEVTVKCDVTSNPLARYKYYEGRDTFLVGLAKDTSSFQLKKVKNGNMSVSCKAYLWPEDKFKQEKKSDLLFLRSPVITANSKQPKRGKIDRTTIGVCWLIFGGIIILGGLMAYRQYKDSIREDRNLQSDEHNIMHNRTNDLILGSHN